MCNRNKAEVRSVACLGPLDTDVNPKTSLDVCLQFLCVLLRQASGFERSCSAMT